MTAILVGLNYHRIGGRDPANPFHRLHTVDRAVFEAQVGHALRLGPFVTLDDVAAGRLADGVSFLLTFDDVSDTINAVRPWLLDQAIPFHVCPTTGIATEGFGIRDKVNWIIDRLDPTMVSAAVEAAYGAGAAGEPFYRLTKSPDRMPDEIETRLIEPLFARVASESFREERAYLSWAELRRDYAGAPGIGVVDHGATHRRMELMDEAAITTEIETAEAAFSAELSTVPVDFAVPFGEPDRALADRLDLVLGPRGYRTVLWVDHRANLIPDRPPTGRPLHLGRLHAPETAEKFREKLHRALAGPKALFPQN